MIVRVEYNWLQKEEEDTDIDDADPAKGSRT